ncbi:MAG: sensor histidine kinase [Planctomycetes bacterium]|nr:sensor histidine kinase [Planctomycetota bacterium]
MDFQIEGMIGTLKFGAAKHLLPLFEAVVNSIQAIEEADNGRGNIEIRILRDTSQGTIVDEAKEHLDIIGFEVIDDGIGFNDDNYRSFDTSFSTYKAAKGGKGVGRFSWLVVFSSAAVESRYKAEGEMKCRSFDFVPRGRGIEGHKESASERTTRRTVVKLNGFRDKYRKACPKKVETIAAKIVENCLEYFLRNNCPRMLLSDVVTGNTVSLNDEFKSQLVGSASQSEFTVKGQPFTLKGLRLSPSHAKEHVVHYCANERVVKSERLAGRIDDLAKTLTDDEGREFRYAGYISASALDSLVTQDRTDFAIDESADGMFEDTLDWKTIQQDVETACAEQLKPFTKSVAADKDARIEKFIETEGPMYRPVLKYIDDKVRRLDPGVNDKQLDQELYRALQDVQVELKAEGKELLELEPSDHDFEGYTERVKSYFDKVGDINQSDLARYVCHRRAVLDFLQHQLSRTDTGKYPLEECVHNVIFPMGKTSNDVPFLKHQLWLVDEKLVYHRYLASDKPLRSMDVLDTKSAREPDIIVFDKACALVNEPDAPFGSVIVVEFKRPMRKNYNEEENPVQQVYNYVREVRDGKALMPNGRPVEVKPNVPFYCYVVCDITEKLRGQIDLLDLTPMPDGQGFFQFHKKLNAYLELVSYTKMITDAKKRNAVFFDMLKLPTNINGM